MVQDSRHCTNTIFLTWYRGPLGPHQVSPEPGNFVAVTKISQKKIEIVPLGVCSIEQSAWEVERAASGRRQAGRRARGARSA